MPTFSDQSTRRLASCDVRLQDLFHEIVGHFDCTILEGHRPKEAQNEAFRRGLSKLQFPDSRHNRLPSAAVDVAPYPVVWDDTERFYYFAGWVKCLAALRGIPLRWGGDWDDDTQVRDQNFMDLVHFEIGEIR